MVGVKGWGGGMVKGVGWQGRGGGVKGMVGSRGGGVKGMVGSRGGVVGVKGRGDGRWWGQECMVVGVGVVG